MTRCIIVDDDQMSRLSLERLCGKVEGLEMVAICENVASALEIMKKEAIDLLFLDIEMPEATGFDLLEQCPVIPEVIITSSKEQYAFNAFQYQVADYLKKPIMYPRFRQAVEKVLMKSRPEPSKQEKDSVFIKVDGRLIQLKYDEILYIENVGDYVRFHTDKDKYVVYNTLKSLAEKLPEGKFLKVHRSYIVNLSHIVDIEEGTIVIRKSVIPVSRANRSALMNRLNLV